MKELFKNCIEILDVDGWMLPTRFTAYQREATSPNERQYIRSHPPSSVCLAFKTKATKISLEYKITGKARGWALFDLKCDGLLADNVAAYIDKVASLYECRNIYAILPIWRGNENEIRAGMTYLEHREVIRRVLIRYPFVKIIDGYKIIPHLPEFYGETTRPSVHPTEEGFLLMSGALVKELF